MLLQIPQIIHSNLLTDLRATFDKTNWTLNSHQNQENQQPNQSFYFLNDDSSEAKFFSQQILKALQNNPLFISSSLPAKIFPPIFRKHITNQHFSTRIDSALLQLPNADHRVRLDLSATIFLSNPDEYDGGELVVEDNYGTHQIKLPAGHAIIFPSSAMHYLKPIKNGQRITSCFWIESMVRSDQQRTILFDIDNSIRTLIRDYQEHESIPQLTGIYHNLLRMWGNF